MGSNDKRPVFEVGTKGVLKGCPSKDSLGGIVVDVGNRMLPETVGHRLNDGVFQLSLHPVLGKGYGG